MPSNTSRPKVGIIEQLLDDLTKQAEARTEPGSIGGASEHPTAKVDDNTQAVSTGQRFAENASDIKAEPNTGAIVDSTSELPVGQMQDAAQVNVGMTSKATGEDPANETGSTKAKKEDGSIGGSSEHPARTDNDSLDGNKYASQYDYFKALCKRAEELGSQAAAAIAVAVEKASEAGSSSCDIGTDKMDASEAPKKQPSDAPTDATEAKMPEEGQKEKMAEAVGAELADIFAKASVPVEDAVVLKQAAEERLAEIIKTAEYRANLAADYYDAHFQELRKMAEEGYEEEEEDDDEESEKSESSEPSDSSGGAPAVAAPAAEPGMGGGEPSLEEMLSSLSEEELAQLLGGGESMGAEGAVGDMGGGEVSADLGVMPPEAGDDMAGAAPMAGGDDAAALEAALAELGMSPQELEMALASKQAAAKRAKQASAKQSADAKQAAFNQKKASMKKMIQELVSRSRG